MYREDRPCMLPELLPDVQATAKQLAQATSEAAGDAAKMRASWHQQVADLERQVEDLRAELAGATQLEAEGAPSHNSGAQALTDRVCQLEAANSALEQALLESHAKLTASGRSEQLASRTDAELQDALATLERRDGEVSRLHAELQMFQAQAAAATVRCDPCPNRAVESSPAGGRAYLHHRGQGPRLARRRASANPCSRQPTRCTSCTSFWRTRRAS